MENLHKHVSGIYVTNNTGFGIDDSIYCTFTLPEEFHNFYSSPSIIRILKLRRIRWAGHVARMGRRGMHIGYWQESQKERDHWKDQDVGGWTILKRILERQDGREWIGLIWLRIETRGGFL
jgi:hypothetical protein